MLPIVKKTTYLSLLIVIFALFSACGTQEASYKGSLLEPPLEIPEFTLMDSQGEPFNSEEIQGDIALVFFGYTFCPDVCPLTLADVREAVDGLENRERVHVIFVSVDPERDTPEALQRYVKAFDPTFIGLTDEPEKIEALMKPFGAYAEKEEVENSAAGYLVNHTARVYLLNPEGDVELMYPFGFKPEDLRSDLQQILQTI